MTNSAKTIKKNSTTAWTNRAKNSASLMRITLDAIDHMLGADKDWTVLAHHISKGIDSKAPPKSQRVSRWSKTTSNHRAFVSMQKM